MSVRILNADCLTALPQLAAEGFRAHSVVTDPPAGISFMNTEWDGDKGGRDQWIAWMQQVAAETLRCVLPGAHALVWALPRTSHWTATAWENAGWQVRDRVAHLFAVGFPKSLDVSKAIDRAAGAERDVIGSKLGRPGVSTTGANQGQGFNRTYEGRNDRPTPALDITAPATPEAAAWAGWGTSLKPACEDWWLLRKPLEKGLSVAANVLRHGTGALNIDSCRVPLNGEEPFRYPNGAGGSDPNHMWRGRKKGDGEQPQEGSPLGRWPANCVHDGSPEVEEAFAAFGERTSGIAVQKNGGGQRIGGNGIYGGSAGMVREDAGYTDTGSASRFFFCAKADATDRVGSRHPTVKPTALMRWLVQLVTPSGGTVLDPFAGTGSTGLAADQLGMSAVLIERDANYVADINKKLAADAPLFLCPTTSACADGEAPQQYDIFGIAS